ncbi:MAG TPA: rod shape-determining protein RodA [Patescibacteria group bacterium]|nr:rod shape-determining protein RodA [Patescibacteria group bacterium]
MKTWLSRIDWQLVIPVAVLLAISLTTIFSVSQSFFRSQLFFVVLGVVFFVIFSQVHLRIFEYLAKPIYFVSLLCLFFLLFLGIASRGAIRWLDIAGFRIQFSEVFKPFLVLALAGFLSDKENFSLNTFLKTLGLLVPVAFLIFKQPDLGSALLYVLAAFLTLILYGFPLWWFGIGAGGFLAIIPIFWEFLHQYQKQRVLTFLHLTKDPLGTSYNAIQAIIAVGSGMLIGKGFGQGTQSALRFLPEKHTDFIFATISEDLGFIGGLIVIGAFLFLFYRLYVIFDRTDDTFYKVFIAGAFSLLLVQFFVNIGMNIGVLPIVGIPLPFVSYGGSSLLSNAILLGCLSNIASQVKRKDVLEIR